MQKVVIVNLNGIAYHLEEAAYAALGLYLEGAERQLAANPDRAEIVGDLEQAIADKFGRYLGASKNVIASADMTTILDEMGPVHDDGATAAGAPSSEGAQATDTGGERDRTGEGDRTAPATGATAKRLYRMLDTGVLGGVCSGLAAFADFDVTLVRVTVALAALFEIGFLHTPLVVVAYLVLLFVVPVADTSEERAAARGIPFNAQQLIDEAKRNFERIGERDWKSTRREWRQQRRWERKYERQMRRTMKWTATWPPAAAAPYGAQVAAGIMTPLLTLVSSALFWLTAYVVISMASTGAVRGWHPPGDLPLWLVIVLIVLVYNALSRPLHLARRASYYTLAGPYHGRSAALDGLIATTLGIAIVWSAYHYSPEIREWLTHLPGAWHNIAASFRS